MISAIDRYLQTLLTFVPRRDASRIPHDYIALIHVPVEGPETVYSLVFDAEKPVLTVAKYRQTVWEVMNDLDESSLPPELDALRVELERSHPALEFLDLATLLGCHNYSDGGAGQDYFLALWQKQGESNVVECYEPYLRKASSWSTLIGAVQVLSSQFEYALAEG